LQPYAHVLRAVLEADPTLFSGLSSGNQAWNLIRDLGDRFGDEFKLSDVFDGVLLGDLERSTDFIEYEVGNLHMESFWKPWENVTPYFKYAHELLLQPFILNNKGTKHISVRGALMGLPGTKILLHTISKAIDIDADGRKYPLKFHELQKHPWRCAGDDVVKFGTLETLRRSKTSAYLYRVKPSENKWGVYLKGGKFCERAIYMDGTLSISSLEESAYKDIVPIRLLSPETKLFSGDEDTNPIFGKGWNLAKELGWYTGSREKAIIAQRLFLTNMIEYGRCEQIFYLPRQFHGLGLSEDVDASFHFTPSIVKRLVKSLRDLPEKKAFVLRALALLRTPLLMYRGVPKGIEETDSAILDLLREFLPWMNTREAASEAGVSSPRFSDQVKALKSKGYVNLYDLDMTHNPSRFWELVKTSQKGWKTAKLSDRISAIEKSVKHLALPEEPDIEEWRELLNMPDPRPNPLWILAEYLNIYGDEEVVPLNLNQRSIGLSLKMKLPNRSLFYQTTRGT
jgi:DNA-binding Lrp family transcriptional regulator